jgi:hypothetical protein
MSRKGWLTIGLSLLLGTGFSAAVPGAGVLSAHGQDVIDDGNITEHRAQVELARWGDGEAGGEQGEIESPRWGDQSGEKGEVESPRWGDQSGEQGEIESPRA